MTALITRFHGIALTLLAMACMPALAQTAKQQEAQRAAQSAEQDAQTAQEKASEAATAAGAAAGAAATANQAFDDGGSGAAQTKTSADVAEQAADTAEAAAAQAGQAAVDAQAAAQDAQQAASTVQATTPAPAMPPATGPVTVTSSPGNSISSNYRIDFAAMDTNGDGNIVRAEVSASGNADLMREFHVVDANHNGRLTREELKGWLD